MEDTLGANGNNQLRMCQPVLILVLMEDTLGVLHINMNNHAYQGKS